MKWRRVNPSKGRERREINQKKITYDAFEARPELRAAIERSAGKSIRGGEDEKEKPFARSFACTSSDISSGYPVVFFHLS